jgi:two-component system CheB/CheR fusion protein
VSKSSDQQRRKGLTPPSLVAGMGASAGGLEALQEFFDQMPPDSGAAFVVIQHLAPNRKSLMPELLARHTQMAVSEVRDETPLAANHVYVIPPNKTLTVQDGTLRLAEAAEPHASRAPIDTFFRSLANDQNEKAVCILLSGAGTDGTLGLRAVKEHGGMAMAQTTESARHDSIPRSAIATGLVDHVLPLRELPAKLLEYGRHLKTVGDVTAPLAAEGAADHTRKMHALLRRRTGHDLSGYKETTFLRRVQRRMQVLQIASLEEYVKLFSTSEEEQDKLFSDLLIGVTHFFRDPEAFRALSETVVPKLFDGKTAEDEVRVFVVGCASGEETYSVAIVLAEYMARLEKRPEVKIFGTDIDQEALETARLGRYPDTIEAHVSRERLERFFVRQDRTYQVKYEIRDMCIFSVHSIIKDPPFSRINLLICRNLLIYFDAEVQSQIIPLFHYALAPDGYLFLGTSEHLATSRDLFKTIERRHRIFQRRATPLRPPAPFPLVPGSPIPVQYGQNRRRSREVEGRTLASAIERSILRSYAPACVVINGRGEAVYFYGRTGKYLEPAEGVPSIDIVGMAREGLRASLRTCIHRAVKTQGEITQENAAIPLDGSVQNVNITVRPMHELGEDARLYIVVFQDVGSPVSKEAAHEGATVAMDEAVAHLERELRAMREDLQTTIEELETSNEELVSSNEELQSANEELQSSKEEYQSLNEELETVNAELKQKVEDLDRANGDLNNLLESIQIASIFLDRNLRIRSFTPAVDRIYHLIHSDVGRPITDFGQRLSEGDLAADSNQVLRTLTPIERLIRRPESDERFKMRILPYRTMDGILDGIVITIIDVSDEKRAEEALSRMNEDLKQFAYAASHDLQEPLRMVTGYTQLLAKEYGHAVDEKGKQYIAYSVDGALRVQNLLRAMRAYWQAVDEPAELRQTDANAALQDALRNLEAVIQENNAVITHDALPEVTCNPVWLIQVFQNLLSNAIKYKGEPNPVVHISSKREGAAWEFSVRDNGMGIEPQHLNRIFGMFKRLHGNKYPGEGIGLALCSKLIERCGGRIWAESEPGKGSMFKFTLPGRQNRDENSAAREAR